MFKRWFEFSSNGNGGAGTGERRNGSEPHTLALMEPQENEVPPEPPPCARPVERSPAPSADCADFQQIYLGAAVKPPQFPGGILKVVEMLKSQHLSGMSPDARRCALLMALEAAGAEIEDLLQDAVVRQRALNDYEDKLQKKLRSFEALKAEENRTLQTELDRLTSSYISRMQANLDEVEREGENFRVWQKQKQYEAQHIAEAAAVCVPEGLGPHSGSLTAVLERACAARR